MLMHCHAAPPLQTCLIMQANKALFTSCRWCFKPWRTMPIDIQARRTVIFMFSLATNVWAAQASASCTENSHALDVLLPCQTAEIMVRVHVFVLSDKKKSSMFYPMRLERRDTNIEGGYHGLAASRVDLSQYLHRIDLRYWRGNNHSPRRRVIFAYNKGRRIYIYSRERKTPRCIIKCTPIFHILDLICVSR